MSKHKTLLLQGSGASGGCVQGVVRLVLPGQSTTHFNDNEVLVAAITDPSMLFLMQRAAAIVTDLGGITSHPAIVARELGIPCVVGTDTATKRLKDGMLIEVNGSTGRVYLIE